MRYFRILFSTGKMNIKENREQKKMRSFVLKDLYKVVLKEPVPDDVQAKGSCSNKQMLTYAQLKKSAHLLDETSKASNWKHSFMIYFPERSFTLHARTVFEYSQWVRIFNLVLQMNKVGCSLIDQNPYYFER